MIVSPVPFENSIGVLVTVEPIYQVLACAYKGIVPECVEDDNLDLVFYIDHPCDTTAEGMAWAGPRYHDLVREIKKELIKPRLLN